MSLCQKLMVAAKESLGEGVPCLCTFSWSNAWFPISWGAALFLLFRLSVQSCAAWVVAVGLSGVVCFLPDLWMRARRLHWGLQAFALVTAAGFLNHATQVFLELFGGSVRALKLLKTLPFPPEMTLGMVLVGVCLVAWPSLFCLLAHFYDRMFLGIGAMVHHASRLERGTVICLVVMLCALAVWVTAQTTAFEAHYDVIYTADTGLLPLYHGRAGTFYLHLAHPENDLRQPLFALFAAPWVGSLWFLWVVAQWLGASPYFFHLGIIAIQVIAVVFGAFLLSRLLGLRRASCRAAVCAWVSVGFGTIVFAMLCAEQYAFAFVWLMLLAYAWRSKVPHVRRLRVLAFLGATGTLVIGGVMELLQYILAERVRPLAQYVKRLIALGCAYVLVLAATMQTLVLFNAMETVEVLVKFTGKTLTHWECLRQWLVFLASAILPPASSPRQLTSQLDGNLLPWESWALLEIPPNHEVWVGGVIAAVCVAATCLLWRRYKAARLCGGWVAVSFLLLGIVGWGAVENGQILYAPYFHWALVGLLALSLAALAKRFRLERALPFVLWACAAVTALLSVHAIAEMRAFLFQVWPVR